MVFYSPKSIAIIAPSPRREGIAVAKPKIDELLIQSALVPDLCRRLLETPDEVFEDYDLTVEERELLRRPDHRLLPLLGAAVERRIKSAAPPDEINPRGEADSAAATEEFTVEPLPPAPASAAPALPDSLMALTVVPCALQENGQFKGISYVLWVNPMAEGTDPATLPSPAGTVLPGQPLAPLHAVIRISAVQSKDASGNLQLGMWGSFLPASSIALPPPAESAGNAVASPFKSPFDSASVKAAVAAVRNASSSEQYDRLADLLHTLHQGDVR